MAEQCERMTWCEEVRRTVEKLRLAANFPDSMVIEYVGDEANGLAALLSDMAERLDAINADAAAALSLLDRQYGR